MGDLTKNLSASEFACRCKYDDCTHKLVADMRLALAIQDAADHFSVGGKKVKIEITGPNRCIKHNADEGGEPNSMHIHCIAADHRISVMDGLNWQQVPVADLYDYYDKKYFDRYGVGLYFGRVHLDTRKQKARWKKWQP